MAQDDPTLGKKSPKVTTTSSTSKPKKAPAKRGGRPSKGTKSKSASANGDDVGEENGTKKNGEKAYAIGDIVTGKIKGYPAWPGIIVDPSTAPDSVLAERPEGKKIAYCVRFFPKGDYAFLHPPSIASLSAATIQRWIDRPPSKSAELATGYRQALAPETAFLPPDDEEEEVDEDGDAEVEAQPKKRKRGEGKVTKAKKEKKSKGAVESEDEDAEGDEEPKPPVNKRSRGAKKAQEEPVEEKDDADKVREWRHKLQKTFLTNGKDIKEEEMPGMDILFTTIEKFENMNLAYLTHSKIGKVMRHITQLGPGKIPDEDETFHFKDRAAALIKRWGAFAKTKEGADAAGGDMSMHAGDASMMTAGDLSMAPGDVTMGGEDE
ncbi:hypothetical protein C8J56DRAFT_243966 [Mycena floridula]|nr:hypothetical protein C8J56DRAFT_243966 [Mycena floridula]